MSLPGGKGWNVRRSAGAATGEQQLYTARRTGLTCGNWQAPGEPSTPEPAETASWRTGGNREPSSVPRRRRPGRACRGAGDRDRSDRLGEADNRNELGIVQRLTGDYRAAAASHQQALEMFRDRGQPLGEAEALNSLGELLTQSAASARARDCHARALAIAREISVPLEEARALEGIGQCHLQGGNLREGAAPLRQALAIYQRIGAPAPPGASRKPSATTASIQPGPRAAKALSLPHPPHPENQRISMRCRNVRYSARRARSSRGNDLRLQADRRSARRESRNVSGHLQVGGGVQHESTATCPDLGGLECTLRDGDLR